MRSCEKALFDVQNRLQEFDLLKAQINSLTDAVKNEAVILTRKETQQIESKLQTTNNQLTTLHKAIQEEGVARREVQESFEDALKRQRKKTKKRLEGMQSLFREESTRCSKDKFMEIQRSLHEQTIDVKNVHSTLSKLEGRVQSIEQEHKSTTMELKRREWDSCYSSKPQMEVTKLEMLDDISSEMHSLRKRVELCGDVLQSLCRKVINGFEEVEDRMLCMERRKHKF